MNIVFVNQHFRMGGLERVSYVVGEGISSYKNVYFYSCLSDENFFDIPKNFIDGRDFLLKVPFLNKVRNKSIRLIDKIKGEEYNPTTMMKFTLLKLVKFINNNDIDLVVLSGPLLIACIPFIKQRTNVKTIAWLHNNYDVYMNDYAKPFITSFRNGLSSSNGAVCLTESDLEKYKHLNGQTIRISNPLTVKSIGISDLNKKIISFTGRYSFKHKGIDFLVEIAKKIPNDWIISVAGTGTIDENKKFEQLIKQNNLENKILLRGPLKDKQLHDHYINSSIYLMTSRWEGFGLVLLEAMNFGLPIIAFSQSGSKEILQDGKYGMTIENGNIEEIAKAINQMCSDIRIRQQYQQLSLNRISDFQVDKITKEWIKYIDELK